MMGWGEGSESWGRVLEGCGLTGMEPCRMVSASQRGWDAKSVFLFLSFFLSFEAVILKGEESLSSYSLKAN